MSECRDTFQGEAVLATLLGKHGVSLSVDEVTHLVAGVNAAAVSQDDADWVKLIAADPSPALAAQLNALRFDLAAKAASDAPIDRAARLKALRAELKRRKLAGMIVPRSDQHQGEYVAPNAERLEWLTGFTGSAGLAIVMPERAAIFVDGRYTLAVRAQVDTKAFEPRHVTDEPASVWFKEVVKAGQAIGYDPWLHTTDQVDRFRTAVQAAGGTLVPVDGNPVDAVWADRPPSPLGPVRVHELAFAGKIASAKRAEIATELERMNFAAAVLTAPDSIAWLLNLRGGDVPHTPLALGFAIVGQDGAVELFIDARKLMPGVREHLGNRVTVSPPDAFEAALDKLGKAKARVQIDPGTAASAIVDRLTKAGADVSRSGDPCALPKACKNPIELEGTRAAHRRDGVAVTRFLAWLAREAPKGGLKEIEVSDKLEAFRREGEHFRDLSFDTISGAGSNGAIVHYRASPATERVLGLGELYLVDSGAQYLDGTTDITRTVAIGTPTAEHRDRFTRVLKGHIAIATARYPVGTTGSQLDPLARASLWQAGLDFDHGTGHGVGSYLSVHEGPQRISKIANAVALKPGMIVSNEPGYYKTGAFGIRIENLVVVQPEEVEGAERPTLSFETITLAPIDRALIDVSLLTPDERAWMDAYHARVKAEIGPLVDAQTRAWLDEVTAPL